MTLIYSRYLSYLTFLGFCIFNLRFPKEYYGIILNLLVNTQPRKGNQNSSKSEKAWIKLSAAKEKVITVLNLWGLSGFESHPLILHYGIEHNSFRKVIVRNVNHTLCDSRAFSVRISSYQASSPKTISTL
jgi:hypothetical protein